MKIDRTTKIVPYSCFIRKLGYKVVVQFYRVYWKLMFHIHVCIDTLEKCLKLKKADHITSLFLSSLLYNDLVIKNDIQKTTNIKTYKAQSSFN